jgi:AbiV family abortive infection protein
MSDEAVGSTQTKQTASQIASALLDRVRTFSDGARIIFENAEALYEEAQILGQGKSFARAATLHQISMEECAKIDILGAHTVSLLVGHDIDDDHMGKIFRDHKVKNQTNAYNASPTPQEREARERGDWALASSAFKEFQRNFHVEVNAIKNAALYVDFQDGRFISPKDAIPEEIAVTLMAMNADFLQRSALFVRLLKRMEGDPQKFADAARRCVDRAARLRQDGAFDPEAVTNELMEELKSAYK